VVATTIGYEDNSYCFIHHIQGNIIFHFIYAIFNKEFFSKYTKSCIKEYKLYNKLLDRVSPETKSSAPEHSIKDEPSLVPIPPILISSIQNNNPPHSLSPLLSYRLLSLLPLPVSKQLLVKINNKVDTNVEIQTSSSHVMVVKIINNRLCFILIFLLFVIFISFYFHFYLGLGLA